MAAPEKKLIQLGHIAGAHGIRGEVLIKSYTELAENISAYGPLRDDAGNPRFAITSMRLSKKGVVVQLDGVTNRDAAEALNGTRLFIRRKDLPQSDQEVDEWYHADLVGLTAVGPNGQIIGEVIAIQNFGAGDLLEICPDEHRETILVPFTNDTVPDINKDDGRVLVILGQF